MPVGSHAAGLNQSQWRSDLGLLNTGSGTANVEITFHGLSADYGSTTYVPSGVQSILIDVVGQFAVEGSGALEVVSNQPVTVTSRIYNQVSSDASCYPDGTQGQGVATWVPDQLRSSSSSSSGISPLRCPAMVNAS